MSDLRAPSVLDPDETNPVVDSDRWAMAGVGVAMMALVLILAIGVGLKLAQFAIALGAWKP